MIAATKKTTVFQRSHVTFPVVTHCGCRAASLEIRNNHVSTIPRKDRLGSGYPTEFQSITAAANAGISVFYANAHGVLLKREELCSVISSCNANVILLTEAWLHAH